MCTALFNRLCLFLSLPSSPPTFLFPSHSTPCFLVPVDFMPTLFLSLFLSNFPLHTFLSSPSAPRVFMGDHICPHCLPPPMIQRGSSDAVCSPRSARLLLYSWSGLEVSHYSGMSPPYHGLLPRPAEPAE